MAITYPSTNKPAVTIAKTTIRTTASIDNWASPSFGTTVLVQPASTRKQLRIFNPGPQQVYINLNANSSTALENFGQGSNIELTNLFNLNDLGEGSYINSVNQVIFNEQGSWYVGSFLDNRGDRVYRNIFSDGVSENYDTASLSGGLNNTVNCLALGSSGFVYFGGEFTASFNNNVELQHVAYWDGSSWYDMSGGLNDNVYAMYSASEGLYVGGQFTASYNGEQTLYGFTKWNGDSWVNLGTLSGTIVRTISSASEGVYFGGTKVSSSTINNYIARWDGSALQELSGGLNDSVYAMYSASEGLYVGGAFTSSANNLVSLNRIGLWNGSSWSNLGSGIGNGTVKTIYKAENNEILVGGSFTSASSTAVYNYAIWNGTTWYNPFEGNTANGFNDEVLTTISTYYPDENNEPRPIRIVGGLFSSSSVASTQQIQLDKFSLFADEYITLNITEPPASYSFILYPSGTHIEDETTAGLGYYAFAVSGAMSASLKITEFY